MNLDKCLRKTYVWILVSFALFFHQVVQPYLYDKFVVDHTRDCNNMWKRGENWEIKVFMMSDRVFGNDSILLMHEKNIKYYLDSLYGNNIIELNYTLEISDNIKKNVTNPHIFVHASPSRCMFKDFTPATGISCNTISVISPVIRWDKKRIEMSHNLIKEKAPVLPDKKNIPILPYFFTNMTYDIVYDSEKRNFQYLEAHNARYYKFSVQKHTFLPPISEDKFLEIKSKRNYIDFALNNTIPICIRVNFRSRWLWNLKLEFDYGSDEYEYVQTQWEDLKRALADTKPILLWSWIILTVAHIILNLLAFKEDISWWSSRDTIIGVSLQTLMFNSASQLIIFLYLMDEDTSPIVRFMKLLSVCVEFWKISKVFEPIMEWPYFKPKKQYSDSTAEFDSQGGKYLRWGMIPLLLIYAVYSLLFKKFKSAYSFLLKISVGAVYGFGFLAMLPQLYVNYKLKSVAGMSGPVLAYKFVNTFVDDLFAFVMTMPLMHRIACFRDDVVFFVWLYQRHIYKVDPNRTNEYGENISKDSPDDFVLQKESDDENVPFIKRRIKKNDSEL